MNAFNPNERNNHALKNHTPCCIWFNSCALSGNSKNSRVRSSQNLYISISRIIDFTCNMVWKHSNLRSFLPFQYIRLFVTSVGQLILKMFLETPWHYNTSLWFYKLGKFICSFALISRTTHNMLRITRTSRRVFLSTFSNSQLPPTMMTNNQMC